MRSNKHCVYLDGGILYLIIAGFAPRTVYLHSPHRIGFDNVFSRLL